MKITNTNALKILFVSNGIFVFADRLLGPLYAIFAEKFDTNVMSVSFSWFVFMLSATVFTALVAKFGDKIKEKEYMLVAGFLIRATCWIMYVFVNNFAIFCIVQVILGIGEAVGSPGFDSIFATHLDKGHEINEYSNWKLVQNFSLAIASLIGGLVVQFASFQVLFFLMAVLAILASIIVLVQPRKLM